jgi:hypothetical protein
VYNGFGRFSEQTPLQLLAGQLRPGMVLPVAAAGPARLLTGGLGRDTGWLLLPAAAIGLCALASCFRRPSGDPQRACLVLWGGWLLVLGVTFSVATAVNPYYTAALSPAVAALLGVGVTMAWSAEHKTGHQQAPAATRWRAGLAGWPTRLAGWGAGRRLGLAAAAAGTAAYAAWLIPATGTGVPGWLVPAVIAVGIVAVVLALASLVISPPAVFTAALAVGLAGGLVVPVVASAALVGHDQGALDTPFEPAAAARAQDNARVTLTRVQDVTALRLEDAADGDPDLAAAQTSAAAAVFIYATGREVLPIGGFDGTIPSPTPSQLQADIRDRKFHVVIAFSPGDPRLAFVFSSCTPVTPPTYICDPSTAG